MKVRARALIVILTALGCLSHNTSYAQSLSSSGFIAHGVNPEDLAASEQFYDNGKGWHFWDWLQNNYPEYYPSETINDLYQASGNSWEFFGDLASHIPDGKTPEDTTRGSSYYDELTNDMQTCWYNAASNILQYWQDSYGVFYRGSGDAGDGSTTLPHGYTYSKDYLDDFAGTQSLRIDMFFYDNWDDVSGNITMSVSWYLAGNNTDASKSGPAKAGFFQEYFDNTWDSYANIYRPTAFLLSELTETLIHGFGLTQSSDGNLAQTVPGQIVEFDIASDDGGGHAVTCYGFDLDEAGNLSAVYLADSDDISYQLCKIYLKSAENGRVYLYLDSDCTQPWGNANWYVHQIGYIQTPESLQRMYAQYHDASNPLVWNGMREDGNTWTASDAGKTSPGALPTEATGWDVRVQQGEFSDHYHSYYQAARSVEFNDHGKGGPVTVAGEVLVPKMILSGSSSSYSFSADRSLGGSIAAEELLQSGAATNCFSEISIQTDSTLVTAGGLRLGSGARLSGDTGTISLGGAFVLDGGAAKIRSVTVQNYSTFAITEAGGSFTGNLTMETGSTLSFTLSDSACTAPLLSFTGNLTLAGTVSLDFSGTMTGGKTYQLIGFTGDGSSLTSGWESLFQVYDGTLSFENGILSFLYQAPTSLTWNSGSGTWSASDWNNSSDTTTNAAVVFSESGSSSTITVSGTVTPGTISITGGEYRFESGNDASIGGDRSVTISNGARVTTSLNFTGRSVELRDNASLTYQVSGASELKELTTEEGTSVRFTGEDNTYTILSTRALNGNLELSDATLVLKLDRDAALGGTISTDAGSTLCFLNASSSADITYTLTQGAESIAGTISIGSDEGISCGTTLAIASNTSAHYQLASNGTLSLQGIGTFSGSASGAGRVEIAENALFTFSPNAENANKLHLTASNSLLVKGELVVGTAGSTTDYMGGSEAAITIVQGGSLKAHLNKSQAFRLSAEGRPEAEFSTLRLDGGQASFIVSEEATDTGDSESISTLVSIEQLEVTSQGGSITLTQNTTLSGYHTVDVTQLSGGGNLEFSVRNGNLTPNLLRIQSTSQGYEGNLSVHNSAALFYVTEGDMLPFVGNAQVELHAGSLGTVSLSQSGNAPYARSGFGVAGEISIQGLDGNDRTHLYSGRAATDVCCYLLESETFAPWLRAESHTLTIDTDADHTFSGSVLRGSAEGSDPGASLSLVKKGSGTQAFLGSNEGLQGGSFEVAGGTLSIAGDLNASHVMLAAGTHLTVSGTLAVQDSLRVSSPEGTVLAPVQGMALPTLEAALDLSNAESLTMGCTLDLSSHALTLSEGSLMLTLTGDLLNLWDTSGELTLFANVTQFTLGGMLISGTNVVEVDASHYLTGDSITESTVLAYDGLNHRVMLLAPASVPEPTTATLGLLALAGMLCRRRRRD